MADNAAHHAPLSRTKTKTHGLLVRPKIDDIVPRTEEEEKDVKKFRYLETLLFCGGLFLFEVFMVTIYGVWFKYIDEELALEEFEYLYNLFRDVNIMIFFGFGFLMTFLRRYGFSAIGYTLLISAVVCQWSIILETFWVSFDDNLDHFSERVGVGIFDLLDGLFCSATVMISYGAVLGKVTPLQLLVMAIVEPFFYWLNVYINAFVLGVFDIGGGYYIHMFGAYFGLAVTFFLTSKKTHSHEDNSSCYSSDIFSLAGTLFLWILWPSFNAVIAAPGIERVRAVVNTFLSLCGATASTFVFSRLLHKGRFDPVHVQNSTLAGGVAMGIAAHLNLYPAVALGIGLLAGIISVLGYEFVTPFLNNYCHVQDICGVHNLHGMPAILAALVSIFASLAISQIGGADADNFENGKFQPLFQLAAIGITLGIACVSGCLCGILMFLVSFANRLDFEDYYNDRWSWILPSDYEHVVREEKDD